jgi:aminopeptidase N
MLGKVQAFADEFIDAGSRRDADAAVENISYRIQLRRDRLPTIDAWLAVARPDPVH